MPDPAILAEKFARSWIPPAPAERVGSALGEGQVRAVLVLVGVPEEVEQAWIGGDDDSGGAGPRRVSQKGPPVSIAQDIVKPCHFGTN